MQSDCVHEGPSIEWCWEKRERRRRKMRRVALVVKRKKTVSERKKAVGSKEVETRPVENKKGKRKV